MSHHRGVVKKNRKVQVHIIWQPVNILNFYDTSYSQLDEQQRRVCWSRPIRLQYYVLVYCQGYRTYGGGAAVSCQLMLKFNQQHTSPCLFRVDDASQDTVLDRYSDGKSVAESYRNRNICCCCCCCLGYALARFFFEIDLISKLMRWRWFGVGRIKMIWVEKLAHNIQLY